MSRFPSAIEMPTAYATVPSITTNNTSPILTPEQAAYARGWDDRGKIDKEIARSHAHDIFNCFAPEPHEQVEVVALRIAEVGAPEVK